MLNKKVLRESRVWLLLIFFSFGVLSGNVHAQSCLEELGVDEQKLVSWCEGFEFNFDDPASENLRRHSWKFQLCEALLVNAPPVASASGPVEVSVNSYFSLDASASSDREGAALSYSWVQLSGPEAILVAGESTALPEYYVVNGSAGEELEFEVTVSDGAHLASAQVSVSVAACESEPGLIFSDCTSPEWFGLTAWEMLDDGSYDNFHYADGHNDNLINWQVLDTGEPGYEKVLDIKYADRSGVNGLPRINTAGGIGVTRDLSEYYTGHVEFDVRVLDWANNTSGMIFRLECIYPCESGYFNLGLFEPGTWQHFSIPVSALADSGLDLTAVEFGFQLSPEWSMQAGVHYQVDNIRWVKGPENPDPIGETFVPSAANWVSEEWGGIVIEEWFADYDQLAFSFGEYTSGASIPFANYLDAPINLEGGALTAELVLPADLELAGTLIIQPFFYDSEFNFAHTPSTQISNAAAGGVYDISVNILETGGLAYQQDGFMLHSVQRVGFLIAIMEDLPTGAGPLRFQNISFTTGG